MVVHQCWNQKHDKTENAKKPNVCGKKLKKVFCHILFLGVQQNIVSTRYGVQQYPVYILDTGTLRHYFNPILDTGLK